MIQTNTDKAKERDNADGQKYILSYEAKGREKFKALAAIWGLEENKTYFFSESRSDEFDVIYKKDDYWYIAEIKNVNRASDQWAGTTISNGLEGHLLKRDKYAAMMNIFYNMSLIDIMRKYATKAISQISEEDYDDSAFPIYINFFSDDKALWWHMDFDIKASWNNIRKTPHHIVNGEDVFVNIFVEKTNRSDNWEYCCFFREGLKEIEGQSQSI